MSLPPVPINEPPGSLAWQQWYLALAALYNTSGAIPWITVSKDGANITDIPNRDHDNLQNMDGGQNGERYHLTSAQHTDLTDGGDSTSHFHATDRARANHTGTQTLATISDAGTMASQNSNNVTITGGAISGVIPILNSYTVATLPSAATYAQGLIYVSDEAGGATVAFSDGTDWRRVQDRAIVS